MEWWLMTWGKLWVAIQTLNLKEQRNIFLLRRKSTLLTFYHCELNPIERIWVKRYTKVYCNYNIHSLCKNINPALDSVPLQSIQKHFQKVCHYMFVYIEDIPVGLGLEKLVKKYQKALKSHRRISEKQ